MKSYVQEAIIKLACFQHCHFKVHLVNFFLPLENEKRGDVRGISPGTREL